ncbi:carboxymuconolactone decarboxylase family protein [Planosporangium sp. 12N6]|uniref:carboxymuconolactone decarboxylase family protein n=1 Tax=Planosporangium spinosum TaxID=3402278 RepID=UPI003CEC601B
MPRIPLVTDSRVGWFTRTAIFAIARRRFGEVPEPLRASANHPGLMRAGVVHELMVERAARRLDPALRDIVVHRVATVVGCSWCVDFGTMLALHEGLSVERHRELDRYRESAAFTPAEKVALEYADAMTAQPMTVTDELVARVREHLDDAGLVELTYLVALENMRARTNHALGLTAQGYTSGDACPLPFAEQISRAASAGA